MAWIRSNRRVGAWVALFALALQLVLSFGHLHLEELGLSPPATTAVAQSGGGGADGTAPGPNHDGRGHDLCAICAALSLAANSVLPAVAALTLPVAVAATWLPDLSAAALPLAAHLIFQARAPPALS